MCEYVCMCACLCFFVRVCVCVCTRVQGLKHELFDEDDGHGPKVCAIANVICLEAAVAVVVIVVAFLEVVVVEAITDKWLCWLCSHACGS
jgi:hypothetical protein